MNLEKVTPASPSASTTWLSEIAISLGPLAKFPVLERDPILANWSDVQCWYSWPEVLAITAALKFDGTQVVIYLSCHLPRNGAVSMGRMQTDTALFRF